MTPRFFIDIAKTEKYNKYSPHFSEKYKNIFLFILHFFDQEICWTKLNFIFYQTNNKQYDNH